MAFELKQNLRQTQSLLLSPQIQQAIKILTLGRAELQEFIAEELKENPCLDEAPSKSEPFQPSPNSQLPQSAEMRQQSPETNHLPNSDTDPSLADLGQALISAVSSRGESTASDHFNRDASENDVPLYEKLNSKKSTLYDDLEDQIRMMHLSDDERSAALLILQYVNNDGYLSSTLEEIASEHSASDEACRQGLEIVQRCEPVGVGARNLQECLLLQIRSSDEAPEIAERIILEHWDDLEKVEIKRIARGLRCDVEEIKEAINFIRSELDPRPARQYDDGNNHYIEPDVYVFQRAGEWVVSLNEDGLPRIKVNKQYEQLVREISGSGSKAEASELRNFVTARAKSARWLVRALAERNKTVLRVTEVIVKRQAEFMEKGVEALKPMTLKNIAEELGLHESTISRATTAKYVQCPQGLLELKYFFNSAMENDSGEQLASETIKVWVSEIIKAEDPARPLSDQDISEMIGTTKKVKVARRTIAKYREGLGIPSSSGRVRKF